MGLFEGFGIELSSQGLHPFHGVEAPIGTFGADHGGLDLFVERVQLLSVGFLTFFSEIDVFGEGVVDVPKSGSILRALRTHIEESLLLPGIDPLSGNRPEHALIAAHTLRLKLWCRNPRLSTSQSCLVGVFLSFFHFYLFDLLIEIVLQSVSFFSTEIGLELLLDDLFGHIFILLGNRVVCLLESDVLVDCRLSRPGEHWCTSSRLLS